MELSPEVKQVVDAAKAAGHTVKSISISDRSFIYRSVTRKEFRDIQKAMAQKTAGLKAKLSPEEFEVESASLKDDAEEMLVLKCLVFPKVLTELDLNQGFLAGSVTTIADQIMQVSGFGADVEPETL